MPGLDSYLVTLGIKGQDVVLATMDKISKKGQKLSGKKTKISVSPQTQAEPARAKQPEAVTEKAGTKAEALAKKSDNNEKKNQGKQEEAQKKFGGAVQNFSRAASSLDPTATISSVTSALGTSLSGISILGVSLGRLPEGLAAIANSTLSMAKNSIDMAKQSTFAFQQLSDRNATTAYYGEKINKPYQLSKNDMAALVGSISGSMGVIQKPLADAINGLSGKKDTRALARVGAGDWESTGTDKGWMLQQIMNGVSGLPPSIKQKMQASLLSKNADLIQGYAPGQKNVQANASAFELMEEGQTEKLYQKTLTGGGETRPEIVKMFNDLNSMQGSLLDAGLAFSTAISDSVSAIQKLPKTLEDFKKSIDEVAKNPSLKSVKAMFTTVKAGN